jgi:hypothetical protein
MVKKMHKSEEISSNLPGQKDYFSVNSGGKKAYL